MIDTRHLQTKMGDSKAETLVRLSSKRTHALFAADYGSASALTPQIIPAYADLQLSSSKSRPHIEPTQSSNLQAPIYASDDAADRANIAARVRYEYVDTIQLPAALAAKQATASASAAARRKKRTQDGDAKATDVRMDRLIEGIVPAPKAESNLNTTSQALTIRENGARDAPPNANGPTPQRNTQSNSLVRRDVVKQLKPEWQPPWKLMRVISGHLGWVRALAVEPDNQWFATGAGDRTIKIWDLASGTLKLTLTGHISTVRGIAVSSRQPYLFSCGEDKMVKCWDLETNKVIRHYHGHLSGVYTLALHPTLDVLVTGGRDGVARVWDMRSRSNIHVLAGHRQTVSSVICQEADPQVITGSLDATVRLWDLAAGKSMGVLTHHKKGVRGLAAHPKEFAFASAATSSIKQWKLPEAQLMQNFEGHNSVINTLSVNEDNVMVSGGDDGSMCFWDWKTGHRFQRMESIAQPGSLDAEAGVMSSIFDHTGLRLLTGEADKTIKVWRQDENATQETHPLEWKPTLGRRKF